MTKLNRRQILTASMAAGVMTSLPAQPLRAANANGEINLGFISCGGRANGLMGQFNKVSGVNIAGLCDVDEKRVAAAKKTYAKADTWTDMREMLSSANIDAVVVSTCNHWHCLAAIWAMQAGKHVYVEKPLSHSQWEGKQTVAAARKYNRICQLGTQQRSDPMQAEIKKFLHQEKGLGEIKSARVNRYGVRPSIGKRDTPLPIEKNIDYDLWLGPAQDIPIYRKSLHYDWHWDWNTGSGEMGNWGVHVLDDVRNNVFLDQVSLPKRVVGGGGRVVWNDAGDTPNLHFAYFDTGKIPVVIGLSNLPSEPGGSRSIAHPGPGSGYVVYCEGGRFEGQRGGGAAYDKEGKRIKSFGHTSGEGRHQANFIQAVRDEDPSQLNANVKVGHDSTGWCNVANVAFRAGGPYSQQTIDQVDNEVWQSVISEMGNHLKAHGLSFEDDSIQLGPLLTMDPEKEVFIGEHADVANPYLKRTYREGYEVPEIELVTS